MKDELKAFLNKCQIIFEETTYLNGLEIPRDILLSKTRYEKVKPDIENLKKMGFSSSTLTALQKNATEQQKWPLLNLVRQILKASNYNI